MGEQEIELLHKAAGEIGINLSKQQIDQLIRYVNLIEKWNRAWKVILLLQCFYSLDFLLGIPLIFLSSARVVSQLCQQACNAYRPARQQDAPERHDAGLSQPAIAVIVLGEHRDEVRDGRRITDRTQRHGRVISHPQRRVDQRLHQGVRGGREGRITERSSGLRPDFRIRVLEQDHQRRHGRDTGATRRATRRPS